MEASREEGGSYEPRKPAVFAGFRVPISAAFILLVTVILLWVIPKPQAVRPEAWRLLAFFVATILGFLLRPAPSGVVVLVILSLVMATGTLPVAKALAGYADANVWLLVAAFLIARVLIRTGMARRVALHFVRRLGHSTLGLGYSLVFSDVVLASVIPSNTARNGGVMLPIARSLAELYHSNPGVSSGLLGTFLMVALYQGEVIASAMFMTGNVSNPVGADLATKIAHVPVDYLRWIEASLLPGLVSIAVVPWIVFRLTQPGIVSTPAAAEFARKELEAMGGRSLQENIALVVFLSVCGLWVTARWHSLSTTTVAFLGVSALFLTGILTWREAVEEHAAWDVFVWYGGIVGMAAGLNESGITTEFARWVSSWFSGWDWFWALFLIGLIYFYAHYGFASITAHMLSMYPPFLGVLLALGAPPELAAFFLLYFTNLDAGLTHYGTVPAPIIFGVGYVSQELWWKVGFLVSLVNIAIWMTVGLAWWKLLGLW